MKDIDIAFLLVWGLAALIVFLVVKRRFERMSTPISSGENTRALSRFLIVVKVSCATLIVLVVYMLLEKKYSDFRNGVLFSIDFFDVIQIYLVLFIYGFYSLSEIGIKKAIFASNKLSAPLDNGVDKKRRNNE